MAGNAKRAKKRYQELIDNVVASVTAWQASLSEFACDLGQAREQHVKCADEAFTAWLVDEPGVRKVTARRAPELLDREYDDEAWMDAAIDDLSASLTAEVPS